MRSLRNHISLIIPLFAILFAVEFYFIIDKIIINYENNLNKDYSIVVVAKKKLTLQEIRVHIPDIQKIQPIDSTLFLKRLQTNGIEIDIKELKNFLPNFYKIYLSSFPSTQKLREIKKRLLQIDGITRVETFTKVHEKIYKFLIFLKNISKLFLGIIFITSIMLVFKQIEIWNLEHSERMYIMALFGAPLWMRNAILIKLSFIDTLISTLLVFGIYYYFLSTNYLEELLGVENISIGINDLVQDMAWLFGLGIIISIFNILIVSARKQKLT
ncbi:cell division transport system permease protein [Nitratiruptor sp. YY08-26]|uniref:hypothetical protein n=1 Tax=unclassified Nitratiruptor TaxID=2624044 RepID=UPI001915A6D4|nr:MULTISPECIES: hypothetical protein [unclassified Nitratiruptor]BCD62106.1 cell division transport system permease protein [Nitratiruptor sp. YY08-13]BCD66042.1 cell division transport system permease protein [Nitratiruptor sp. YY08-26]